MLSQQDASPSEVAIPPTEVAISPSESAALSAGLDPLWSPRTVQMVQRASHGAATAIQAAERRRVVLRTMFALGHLSTVIQSVHRGRAARRRAIELRRQQQAARRGLAPSAVRCPRCAALGTRPPRGALRHPLRHSLVQTLTAQTARARPLRTWRGAVGRHFSGPVPAVAPGRSVPIPSTRSARSSRAGETQPGSVGYQQLYSLLKPTAAEASAPPRAAAEAASLAEAWKAREARALTGGSLLPRTQAFPRPFHGPFMLFLPFHTLHRSFIALACPLYGFDNPSMAFHDHPGLHDEEAAESSTRRRSSMRDDRPRDWRDRASRARWHPSPPARLPRPTVDEARSQPVGLMALPNHRAAPHYYRGRCARTHKDEALNERCQHFADNSVKAIALTHTHPPPPSPCSVECDKERSPLPVSPFPRPWSLA